MKRKSRVQQTDRLSGGAEATAPARNVLTIREELRTLRYRYTHIAQAVQSLEKLLEPRGEEATGMVTGSISHPPVPASITPGTDLLGLFAGLLSNRLN
jgi:hypothetical protein